jgi:energy-coupling factor transporter ATP-binding protein EcfA2
MILLKSLEVINFRNIEKTQLNNFDHLNIFIGPNNCGKTSILKSIWPLGIPVNPEKSPNCRVCQDIKRSLSGRKMGQFGSIHLDNIGDDKRFKSLNYQITYTFEKPIINVTPEQVNDTFNQHTAQGALLSEIVPHYSKQIDWGKVKILSQYNTAFTEHILPIEFNYKTLMVDDNRLHLYKGRNLSEYLVSINMVSGKMNEFVGLIKNIIDPKIIDLRSSTGSIIFPADFEDRVENQGSGVRSLMCTIADILALTESSIIMIDEPELGLTPHVKQQFMKYLSTLNYHQLFIATHDPAFLNPILIPKERNRIYLFTPTNPEEEKESDNPRFVEINPNEPHTTFSGYLPHTESLKPIHIYVEGNKDVKAIQAVLLDKLKSNTRLDLDTFNKISIFHLGGDFWCHIMYTVLKEPYISIVILDKDKSKLARTVCEDYQKRLVIGPSFALCENEAQIDEAFKRGIAVVYCLKKGDYVQKNEDAKTKEEVSDILDVVLKHVKK